MHNIKKSSLLQGVFCVGIGLLSTIVAIYSYIGEKPFNSAITAVCLMLASVLLSGANVWLTQHKRWKRWTAYVVPGMFLIATAAAAYNLWDFLPLAVGAQWWFNVSVSVAFASMLVALITAHFVFDDGLLERAIRAVIPSFCFVSDRHVMNQARWSHDPDLLLRHLPQHRPIHAFKGAGPDDVVRVLYAMMSWFMNQRIYLSLEFDPNQGTQKLPSGKLVHRCVAASSERKVSFACVLDPEKGEGIVIESVCA